jgi:dolichyl-phosphate beta-glucosyltransferase
MTLSVVIPAFNEEKRIGETLRRITAYLSLKKYHWEIVVTSDGSVDGTDAIVRGIAAKHPEGLMRLVTTSPNHGKGFAVRQGVMAAHGEHIYIADADMSSPIKEVDKLVAALESGADVAIGSRAKRVPGCDVRQSFKRVLSGRIFNALVQLLVLPGIRDSQCGFKCFRRETARKLFSAQKLDGFAFDVEVLYLARLAGMRIDEIPIMWAESGESKVNLVRDAAAMIKDLLRIKSLHR